MLFLDETKLERRSLARNEYLFRQGDKVQAIYFVEDGRLRLDRRTFDGRSLVFGTSSAGEFFVEAALFAEIFHCDAVATEPSRVRIYPKAAHAFFNDTTPMYNEAAAKDAWGRVLRFYERALAENV